MKLFKPTLLFLITISFFLTGNSGISNSKISSDLNFSSDEKIQNKFDYTYIKVYENGSWWMYVYDGYILIDRYWVED